MNDEELKDTILGTVEDLVSNFLYYDREEDEDLPPGAIEDAVKRRVVSIEDIVAQFGASLIESLEPCPT